ncbi:putative FMN-binding domain-containing protein [Mycena vulgaris]|nr:putative FMN-binding domain-containing protein [Mycena vulgaris]
MYLRANHAEPDIPTLRSLIRSHPLGIFTTAIPSPSGAYPLLQSSHIPFLLDLSDEDSETELGVLRGHMARANPQAKAMIESLKASTESEDGLDEGPRVLEQDVMILFNSPTHHYVTPKFYTEVKPASGKVVPTWNYAAVQVYGRARVYFDSKSSVTDAYLSKQVADLSQMCETVIMGHERPWTVEEAPQGYVEAQKKGIIGVEVEVTSIGGKWKMSQERPEGDRNGVVEGFEALGSDLGRDMAGMVREREEVMERRKAERET